MAVTEVQQAAEGQQQQQEQASGFTTFSSFFSSWLPSAKADEKEEEEDKSDDSAEESKDDEEEAGGDDEEEEEEEPEDVYPEIREKCADSKECANLKHHFEHCQERVEAGKGHKGEDCVEELFHLMHCVDNCAAPKLFAKLK